MFYISRLDSSTFGYLDFYVGLSGWGGGGGWCLACICLGGAGYGCGGCHMSEISRNNLVCSHYTLSPP